MIAGRYFSSSPALKTERSPVCPECGNQQMVKEVSRFAMLKGVTEPDRRGRGEEGRHA